MDNFRNHALGFAERTRKNLEYIETAFGDGVDVRVVTQLANSLLGLIVFPWEKDFAKSVAKLQVDALVKQGWPRWEIRRGYCRTLGDLVRRLRNAVAHGHMRFSSDSRLLEEVFVEVADFKPDTKEPYWIARIRERAAILLPEVYPTHRRQPWIRRSTVHQSSRMKGSNMTRFRQVELPAEVSGHLSLYSMPGRYEPLVETWSEVQRLAVAAIVSLAPLDEIREKSPEYAESIETNAIPCQLWRLAICDYQGPDDDQAFWQLATRVMETLRQGDNVLVHCGAGIGRTGMFAIAVLMALRLVDEEAQRRVKAAGSEPERLAQRNALRRLARFVAG
jgi:protein-tyrosine phosphatase